MPHTRLTKDWAIRAFFAMVGVSALRSVELKAEANWIWWPVVAFLAFATVVQAYGMFEDT